MGYLSRRISAVIAIGALVAPGAALAQRKPPAPVAPVPPPPPTATELATQGTDLYRAGDYAGAVDPLKRAHEMEPNNYDYRFGLAQALRQSGNCEEALAHYKALVDNAPDPATGKEVRAGMEQCPGGKPEPPPPPPPPPAPPPQVIIQETEMSTQRKLMLAGAGAGLGAAVCLFLAGHWSSDDADAAASYYDHDRLSNRSTVLYISSFVAAGAAIGLGAFSLVGSKKSEGAQVSIAPRTDGGAVVIGGSW